MTASIWTGLGERAEGYDVLFCDVWGVVHNGAAAYPGALDAMTRFRAKGGTVVLVSNAPRPGGAIPSQLRALKVPDEAWDAIVTSGDVSRRLIAACGAKPFLHIGPERDKPLLEGLPGTEADIDDAEFVVCSGLYDDTTETPDDYAELLAQARARDLDMICANPDLVVHRGGETIFCGGAIAEAYRALGGRVSFGGKPHRPIYEEAHATADRLRGAPVSKGRILAVGDAFRTDVAGAVGYGVDSLMIAGGIHAEEFGLAEGELTAERAALVLARSAVRPTGIMDVLVW